MTENKQQRLYSSALSLGLNMAAGMAAFSYLGYRLDQGRGGGYGWTLAGIFLGLFYGGFEVWKVIKQNQNMEGSEDQKEK